MEEIKLQKVSFAYPEKPEPVFTDLSLTFNSDWKLGVIGRNGQGKTTLLKLIAGQLHGSGVIQSNLPFQFFPFPVADTELVRDFFTRTTTIPVWQLKRELTLLGVDASILYREYGTLSGGEKTKVQLSMLFADETTFKLIDEPTNHLDQLGNQQVIDYLQHKQGFMLVSHNAYLLDQVCDQILALEKTGIQIYHGNYRAFREHRQLAEQERATANAKIERQVAKLEKSARQHQQWSQNKEKQKFNRKGNPDQKVMDRGMMGNRAARLMKKAKVAERKRNQAITEQTALKKATETIEPLELKLPKPDHSTILRLNSVQLGYGDRQLFAPQSFTVNRGDVLGIVGGNGRGKTSLLQAILGTFSGTQTGEIQRRPHLTISPLFQTYHHEETIPDYIEKMGLDRELFLSNLHKLGVARTDFAKRIDQMSAGQQKRIELARSLSISADLYLWDEPLNYLDEYNRRQLVAVIKESPMTLLVIDHDLEFIHQVASPIIDLER
ncbi:ribosomal protection-like ABC-F family protein [Fructilactobacillus carniphilus]|uniref:ATP-binding cassette domain-containing protein n=1 Tax=Fructilactobacillus carniphilus TaxID=2940297 RepID=A0ABY5BYR2_9LACO|nr:ATP-binding cassette domain-containing protein [Fructilactobacillus carniphilus]USS90975.1 ATP-binding cassette domain-containing protein [Fructilactobacillus carniphilus]